MFDSYRGFAVVLVTACRGVAGGLGPADVATVRPAVPGSARRLHSSSWISNG